MPSRRFHQLSFCELDALRNISQDMLSSKDDRLQTALQQFEFRRDRLASAIQAEESEPDPTLRAEKRAHREAAEALFEGVEVPPFALRKLERVKEAARRAPSKLPAPLNSHCP